MTGLEATLADTGETFAEASQRRLAEDDEASTPGIPAPLA